MRTRTILYSRWTRLATLGVAAALALGLGCGKNRVVLDVDVRSFMKDSDLTRPYLAPSLIPISIRMPAVPINLVEGYKDFGRAEDVAIDVAVRFDNATGTGQGQFTLYFGADSASAYAAPPVARIDASLTPGTSSTGTAHIEADQRVLDLFTSKQMVMGIEFSWQPESADVLQGTCTVSRIHAHLVSTLDLF